MCSSDLYVPATGVAPGANGNLCVVKTREESATFVGILNLDCNGAGTKLRSPTGDIVLETNKLIDATPIFWVRLRVS